ncbi:MAG: Ohr family peroxiredoxin [Clostridia bacterium]|nr:Ohr family peroxiredoxin [Clostridia bacterium]
MKKLYTATMVNTGGRNGHSAAPDGSFAVDVVQPKELTGVDTAATNPEQLFAAAYSACFHGALAAVLEKARAKHEGSTVTVNVHLLEDPEDGGWMLGADIRAEIRGIERAQAEKYVALAHKMCPYSKAIRGRFEVTVGAV